MPDPAQRLPELAANGDDPLSQIEGLERELRQVHLRLDGVLCAVESLLQSPALDPYLQGVLRDALVPAANAISGGATLMLSRLDADADVIGTGTGW